MKENGCRENNDESCSEPDHCGTCRLILIMQCTLEYYYSSIYV